MAPTYTLGPVRSPGDDCTISRSTAWSLPSRRLDSTRLPSWTRISWASARVTRITSQLILDGRSGLGMLVNSPEVQSPYTRVGPAIAAYQEIDLWRPFLHRFPDGERKFVHWSFWPSTVFTAEAARDLVDLFRNDRQLREIMEQTRIWASEEVVLPTLVALLGYEIAPNPCSYDYVRYRMPYSLTEADVALSRPDVFWIASRPAPVRRSAASASPAKA